MTFQGFLVLLTKTRIQCQPANVLRLASLPISYCFLMAPDKLNGSPRGCGRAPWFLWDIERAPILILCSPQSDTRIKDSRLTMQRSTSTMGTRAPIWCHHHRHRIWHHSLIEPSVAVPTCTDSRPPGGVAASPPASALASSAPAHSPPTDRLGPRSHGSPGHFISQDPKILALTFGTCLTSAAVSVARLLQSSLLQLLLLFVILVDSLKLQFKDLQLSEGEGRWHSCSMFTSAPFPTQRESHLLSPRVKQS